MSDYASESLGIVGLLGLLLRKRWWIVAMVAVGATLGLLFAFFTQPVYRATALLLPVVPEGGDRSLGLGDLGALATIAGVSMGRNNNSTEEALAVFRSRRFTDAYISEKGLAALFFPEKWDPATGKWRVHTNNQPTVATAYEYFDNRVRTISRDTSTGMVTLRIDWFDPHQAATWTNDLVRRINVEMRRRAVDKANASLKFLRAEVQGTVDVGTREAIYRLIEGQVKQRMLANVTEEFAFRIVDPAVVPDLDQPVRPKRSLVVALGLFGGFVVGVLVVLSLEIVRALTESLRSRV